MNPVLKKLARPDITAAEIAESIRKHIGESGSEYHCQEAVEAINKIRDRNLWKHAQFTIYFFRSIGYSDYEVLIQVAQQMDVLQS